VPGDRALVIGVFAFHAIEGFGMNDAPSGGVNVNAEVGMQHFVEQDVANEELGHEVLVEIGVNANQVVFGGETSEPYRASVAF